MWALGTSGQWPMWPGLGHHIRAGVQWVVLLLICRHLRSQSRRGASDVTRTSARYVGTSLAACTFCQSRGLLLRLRDQRDRSTQTAPAEIVSLSMRNADRHSRVRFPGFVSADERPSFFTFLVSEVSVVPSSKHSRPTYPITSCVLCALCCYAAGQFRNFRGGRVSNNVEQCNGLKRPTP